MIRQTENIIEELEKIIKKNAAGFGMCNKHLISLVKFLCVRKIEDERIWRHYTESKQRPHRVIFKEKLEALSSDFTDARVCADFHSVDKRLVAHIPASKSSEFPDYNAHFLIPKKLAIGEGPNLIKRPNGKIYDSRLRFIEAICRNNITKVIAIGPSEEKDQNGVSIPKFNQLFVSGKKSSIGSYDICSKLIAKSKTVNKYHLIISNNVSGVTHTIVVEHLFTIEDKNLFPEDDNINILRTIITAAADIMAKPGKIFCHCSAGIGRSGILAMAICLVSQTKAIVKMSDSELANYIYKIWDSFNSVRPAVIASVSSLYNAFELANKSMQLISKMEKSCTEAKKMQEFGIFASDNDVQKAIKLLSNSL